MQKVFITRKVQEILKTHPGPRDWPEDYQLENGQYWCTCVTCRSVFFGHKNRVMCKLCVNISRKAPLNGAGRAKHDREHPNTPV